MIDTFKDIQKVQDYKSLKKLSDLGISLKRHVFVDNCQCSEFLKYISQVLGYIYFLRCYFCFLETVINFFCRPVLNVKGKPSLLLNLNMSLRFLLLSKSFSHQITRTTRVTSIDISLHFSQQIPTKSQYPKKIS